MEDYRNSKEFVIFPYTLTDHYDNTQAMQKLKVNYYGNLLITKLNISKFYGKKTLNIKLL